MFNQNSSPSWTWLRERAKSLWCEFCGIFSALKDESMSGIEVSLNTRSPQTCFLFVAWRNVTRIEQARLQMCQLLRKLLRNRNQHRRERRRKYCAMTQCKRWRNGKVWPAACKKRQKVTRNLAPQRRHAMMENAHPVQYEAISLLSNHVAISLPPTPR